MRFILHRILGNSASRQIILCWLPTECVDYLPCLCDSLWLKMGSIKMLLLGMERRQMQKIQGLRMFKVVFLP